MGELTAEDRKGFQLMGLDPRGRAKFFQGQRKQVGRNFTRHVCYLCGKWVDCWLDRCNHVTCSLVGLECCEPKETALTMKGLDRTERTPVKSTRRR